MVRGLGLQSAEQTWNSKWAAFMTGLQCLRALVRLCTCVEQCSPCAGSPWLKERNWHEKLKDQHADYCKTSRAQNNRGKYNPNIYPTIIQ